MSNCLMCGQHKEMCSQCSQNYSDMFIPKDISKIDKIIELDGKLFDIDHLSYIGIVGVPEDKKFDWAVHQWDSDRKTKFVIAFLRWNPKSEQYSIESCGVRLCEYGFTELLQWIGQKAEELTIANRNALEENCYD